MKRGIAIVALLLVGLTAYITYMLSVPSGSVVIKKSFLDSLACIKPDTIKRIDTIPAEPDTFIIQTKVPYPVYVQDSTLLAYHDSLENTKISIHLYDTITKSGIFKSRKWMISYKIPMYIIKENTIIKPIPTPYPFCEEKNRLRYYAKVGVGVKAFSVEGGVVFRDRFMLGVESGNRQLLLKGGYIFN